MHDVWIAGADMTRVGRLEDPLQDLMAVATHAALRSADRERPDSIVVATMNPEEFLGEGNFASNVATHMGFANVPVIRVETATSSGAAAFYAGFAQIASGLAHTVLVVGGEKMTHLPTPKVSELIGRSLDPYERSYGTTMPAFAALVTRALMARHGVGERELAQVAVKNHANGAAAIVLTAERTTVRVAGVGQGTDALALRHRESLTSFRATQAAASAAFAMAGFGPERIDVAEIHDAFTPFELISLEDVGLFPPGKSAAATLDGETSLEGRLPINPSGGLKARGHPLAATGLAQIVECVWQLTGCVPRRQVQCSVALAQSIGGPGTNNWVTIRESR